MVVEDPFVSGFVRNVLKRRGYEVAPVEAADGIGLLRASDGRICLLITNLPGAFTEFAERVPLLYLAAFPDPKITSSFRSSRTLRKPFHPDQLFAYVEQLLQSM